MISVGTQSRAQAKRDLTLVIKYPASKQIIKPVSLKQIRNIVVTVDLGESLDIETLYSHIGSIVYEPEVFQQQSINQIIVQEQLFCYFKVGKR